jgi:gliding motility-associated-like protein
MHKQAFIICLALLLSMKSHAQCGACESFNNKIVNGDFENGNSGFTTSLNYVTFFPFLCTLCPENNYAIGNNANLFHSGFAGTDHTNPPTGDFFIANAPGQNGSVVWCQTVNVIPETDYTFTFWARDIADNSNPHPLAKLRPSFNGIISSDSLIAEGGWTSFSMNWFSDTLTEVEICILNYQTETGGNDFGLDDISLTACEPIILSQEAFAGNDTTICSRDVIDLGMVPATGYSYEWSANEGLTSISIGNPSFQINNTGGVAQEYLLWVARDSANVGCIAADTIAISVLPMEELVLAEDITICPGDSTLLECPGNWDSITWSTGDTTTNVSVTSGTYFATVATGVCEETDSITVLEQPIPPNGLPEEISHCNTTPLVLEASIEGLWFFNGNEFENPIIITESGTFVFRHNDGICTTNDTVWVDVYDPLFANLLSDTVLCEGTTATLTSAQAGTWSTGVYAATLDIATPGIYSISITNGPCTTGDTTNVTALSAPQLYLGADTTFCEDYPLTLYAGNEDAQYLWSTGDTTASIITSGSGIYEVVAENLCGVASDEILITNFPCSWAVHIPSCFTPNEDTFNESWGISGYNLKAIDLTVYNRFGDAIFHSESLDNLWSPSTQVGDDIYNYRIEITPFEGSSEVRTGVIYLVR